jgi:hypothetical protein
MDELYLTMEQWLNAGRIIRDVYGLSFVPEIELVEQEIAYLQKHGSGNDDYIRSEMRAKLEVAGVL